MILNAFILTNPQCFPTLILNCWQWLTLLAIPLMDRDGPQDTMAQLIRVQRQYTFNRKYTSNFTFWLYIMVLVFLCMCVHVCAGAHVYVWVCAHVKARKQHSVSFLRCHPPLLLETGSLLAWNLPSRLGCLAVQPQEPLVSTSPVLGLQEHAVSGFNHSTWCW